MTTFAEEGIELNRIYHEDCLEGMRRIADESVDLLLTDPPYNVSRKNNFHTMRGRSGIDFGEWDHGFDQTTWIKAVAPKIKKGGSLVIFNGYENMGIINEELRNAGMDVKQLIIWRKTNPMPRNRDRLYVTSYEVAIWAVKGKGWTFNRQRETYENGFFEYPTVHHTKRFHPTQKPIELIEDLIAIHSNDGDLILDAFMGSGTTAVAAINTGRNFIGFELEEEYVDIANKRIEEALIAKGRR